MHPWLSGRKHSPHKTILSIRHRWFKSSWMYVKRSSVSHMLYVSTKSSCATSGVVFPFGWRYKFDKKLQHDQQLHAARRLQAGQAVGPQCLHKIHIHRLMTHHVPPFQRGFFLSTRETWISSIHESTSSTAIGHASTYLSTRSRVEVRFATKPARHNGCVRAFSRTDAAIRFAAKSASNPFSVLMIYESA